MSAKVRTSAMLGLLIGLSRTGAEPQDKVSFTAATGLSGRKFVISSTSVSVVPQVSFKHISVGLVSYFLYTATLYSSYLGAIARHSPTPLPTFSAASPSHIRPASCKESLFLLR